MFKLFEEFNTFNKGAVFSLIGLLVAFFYRYRARLNDSARQLWRSLIFSAVLMLAVGVIPGSIIDNWGHLGGFLMGAGLGMVLERPQPPAIRIVPS